MCSVLDAVLTDLAGKSKGNPYPQLDTLYTQAWVQLVEIADAASEYQETKRRIRLVHEEMRAREVA
ncbi:hypothetical protein GS530_05955 [Rhodococcus hoagii]|nr:hypothetical protein [Prescottella equi]